MQTSLSRALTVSGALVLAAASTACVDEARCDAALEGVSRARAEAAQRDQQIAWLTWRQAQPAGSPAEREALRQRVTLLELENASLAARLAQAEQKLAEAAPSRALSARRRLDEAVPYVLADARVPAATSGKREDSIVRRLARPSRRLDTAVPYEPGSSAVTMAPPAESAPPKRTLDEAVPY